MPQGQAGLRFTSDGAQAAIGQIKQLREQAELATREQRRQSQETIAQSRAVTDQKRAELQSINTTTRQITASNQQQVAAVKAAANAQIEASRRVIDANNQLVRQQNLSSQQRKQITQENIRAERAITQARKNSALEVSKLNTQLVQSLSPYKQRREALTQEINLLQRQQRAMQRSADAAKRTSSRRVDSLNQQIRGLTQFSKTNGESESAVGSLLKRVAGSGSSFGRMGSAVSGASSSLMAFLGPVGLVIAALAVLAVGIIKLGMAMTRLGVQGGRAIETMQTFAKTVGGVGGGNNPAQFLEELRKQTRGTVSDLELMQLTIRSLQGTTQEFRDAVAPNLGTVFDATSRIARAGGQGANEIRQKFIFGLRRGENRLLDDIGVKVDAIAAQRKFAEQIEKTSESLTEEEKRIAFVQEAIVQLNRTAEELGEPNKAVDNMAKINATLANMKMQVSLALEPFAELASRAALNMIELGKAVLNEVIAPIRALFNEFRNLSNVIQQYGDANSKAIDVARAFAKMVGLTILLVRDSIVVFRGGLVAASGFVNEIVKKFPLLNEVLKFLGKFFGVMKAVTKLNMEQLAFLVGLGAGNIIGEFAGGILNGVAIVTEAVTMVAQVVADFLVGFSPPKRGPLTKIGQGGLNVSKAWVDGFIKGLLDFEKRSDVLNLVNTRLGDIASFNLEQVDKRLRQLDIAIRPFQERLEIVKADMEAVAGFVDPALEAIERVRSRSIRALKRGGGDIEALRTLDRQAAALRTIGDLRQDAIDQAQLQLSLAQARQVQERALLLIQKRRLGSGGGDDGLGDTGGAGGGGGGGEEPGAGGTPAGLGDPFDLLPSLLGGGAPSVLDDLGAGFAQGLEGSGFFESLDRAQKAGGGLSGVFDEIAGADPASAIIKKFDFSKFEEVFEPVKEALKIFSLAEDGEYGQAILNTLEFVGILDGETAGAAGRIINNFATLVNGVTNSLGLIVAQINPFAEGSAASAMLTGLFDVFGNQEGQGLYNALESVKGFRTDVIDELKKLSSWITGGEGGWDIAINFPEVIASATKAAMLSFATAIENGIINVVKAVDGFINDNAGILAGAIPNLPPPQSGFITGAFSGVAENARGSLGFSGSSLVGESGRELVNFRKPADIFPNRATEALLSMASTLARHPSSHIYMTPGGSGTTYNNKSATYNFNERKGSRNANIVRARRLQASFL